MTATMLRASTAAAARSAAAARRPRSSAQTAVFVRRISSFSTTSVPFASAGPAPLSVRCRAVPPSRPCRSSRAHFSSSSRSKPPSGGGSGETNPKSSSSNVSSGGFEPPPKIELKPSKSPLYAQAAKAQQLHAELEALLEKQSARRAEEASRPFYQGFLNFVRSNKSEMINIGAAFACVLLAYQIVALRKGARTLVERVEERDGEAREIRELLGSMREEDFAGEVARKCSRAIEGSGLYSSGSAGGAIEAAATASGRESAGGWGGLLGGWRSSSSTTTTSSAASMSEENPLSKEENYDELAAILRPVLLAELRAAVGEAHLSDEEKEEQHLKELTKMMGVEGAEKGGAAASKASAASTSSTEGAHSMGKHEPSSTTAGKKGESALGGLEDVLAEAVGQDPNEVMGGTSSNGEGGTASETSAAATKKRVRYAI